MWAELQLPQQHNMPWGADDNLLMAIFFSGTLQIASIATCKTHYWKI